MRKKIVDGVSYECPMYLVRAGDGWQIRPPGLSTRYFADNLYGGVGAAYEAAFLALSRNAPSTGRRRRVAHRGHLNNMPPGTPDVFRQETLRPVGRPVAATKGAQA